MNYKLNMSAGELFDLIRPAVLLIATLVSTWVLASARRRGFRLYQAVAWALGTLLFPPIVFPIYLIVLYRKRKLRVHQPIPFRFVVPLAYFTVVASVIAFTMYRDLESVDAHLARATYARISNNRKAAIREYRAALQLEDDPHTHKLLAIELAAEGSLTEALSEFKLAEKGGENDEIYFRIARIQDIRDNLGQAKLDYQRFLDTPLCTQQLPDDRCNVARARLSALSFY